MDRVLLRVKDALEERDVVALLEAEWEVMRAAGSASDPVARALLAMPLSDVYEIEAQNPMGIALSGAEFLMIVKTAASHVPVAEIARAALIKAAADLVVALVKRIGRKRGDGYISASEPRS